MRYVEKRLGASPNPDPLGVPDILLMVSDAVVVFDNLAGKMHAIVLVDPAEEQAFEQGQARLQGLLETLRQPITPRRGLDLSGPQAAEPEFRSSYTREDYENAVGRIKEYILAGDCMQVVPSQRMSIDFKAAPIDLYRALRCFNPTPYMYFFNFGDFHVVGSSPEVLVRVEDNLVTVRPIAGTRPRGATEEADRALEDDLLSDDKEIAEHLMLIDLGRNDVGRVSSTGSVRLTEKMVIERYSNVMHIVSNVTGQLREGLTAMDALRAILPAGTLSGAPKIRAMEIIDELEPVKRGVYGGAVGYFAWNGNMDTAIAIRTAVIKDGELHVQAGGGIVADSVPALEWEETINKRRAMFRAVALAEQTSAK
ncbi:Anthranilate synthase component 1 [compost metagenome]